MIDPRLNAQIESFEKDFDILINRYASEYDMPVALIVGMLAMKQHELMENNLEDET